MDALFVLIMPNCVSLSAFLSLSQSQSLMISLSPPHLCLHVLKYPPALETTSLKNMNSFLILPLFFSAFWSSFVLCSVSPLYVQPEHIRAKHILTLHEQGSHELDYVWVCMWKCMN